MENDIKELAGTVNELLINITGRIDDICTKYRTDAILEKDRIVNLVEDLDALTEGISVIGPYYDKIDLSEFQEKLSFMTESLGKSDSTVFIDTIDYELKPLLEFWSGLLTKE